MPARTLDLPPLFRLALLREAGDAFAHATTHARRLGAGTLVFVGRCDIAEFAVVLEPEEPLAQARRCFYAGMSALADTLAALAPAETTIAIAWPDALAIDGGRVGGGRLGWPREAREDAVADWLVFGAVIRLVALDCDKTALDRQSTALTDEGFGDVGAERIAEGFARHFARAIDRWQAGEFAAITREYLARLRPEPGMRQAIGPTGNLRSERPGRSAMYRDLRAALAVPSWLDPATGAFA